MSAENTDVGRVEEKVLFVAHRHWASMIPTGLQIIALAALFIVLWSLPGVGVLPHGIFTLLLPLSFLVCWILFLLAWTVNYLNMLILTDRRVIYTEQRSLINRTVQEWNIHEVRHVSAAATNFFETYFNYGTIGIESAQGGASTYIEGMADPEYISAVILRQDDRFERLKDTARKQQELLKFVSHEVKGHLTKSKAAFAAIIEGDYGPVATPLGTMAKGALADSQKGVDMVMSILDDSQLKSGALTFTMRPFDLALTVRRAVDDFRPSLEERGIAFTVSADETCVINGDEEKLARHVIRNLIDNALRYTPKGSINVSLTKNAGLARLSVTDTGVGIAASDMHKLFTWGGHGEHSRDVNPESTGYGLYIAKRVVDGHEGHMWAQSGGPGTGSRFFVELPLAK